MTNVSLTMTVPPFNTIFLLAHLIIVQESSPCCLALEDVPPGLYRTYGQAGKTTILLLNECCLKNFLLSLSLFTCAYTVVLRTLIGSMAAIAAL